MRRAWLVVLALGCASVALAQSQRPGMRLTVTRVAPTGGFTASGFLVVHTSTITATPAPECGPGTIRFDVHGVDARGRVRGAHLVTLARTSEMLVDVGSGPCDARIDVTLEDGTVVRPPRGTIHARLVGTNGLDATIESTEIDTLGIATTVRGHILLSSSP